MKKHFSLWAVMVITTMCAMARPEVYGWLEYIYTGSADYRLNAKLDSGAKTSSLDARSIKSYKNKSGEEMVRFKVKGKRHDGKRWVEKQVVFRKPVHRKVKVKSSNGISEERLSVIMPITIGKKTVQTEFTLSSRSGMNYPVLLGRKTISKIGLIDCSKTFIASKSVQNRG